MPERRRASIFGGVAALVVLGLFAGRLASRDPAPAPRPASPAPAASNAAPAAAPPAQPAPAATTTAPTGPEAPARPVTPAAPADGAAALPGPETTQDLLRAAVEAHLPGRKLSSDELARASEALLRMREARRELAELPLAPENAERLRELREELARAAGDFEYVMEMSPAEFTARVQPEAGLSQPDPDEVIDPPEFIQDLPPRD